MIHNMFQSSSSANEDKYDELQVHQNYKEFRQSHFLDHQNEPHTNLHNDTH